MAASFQTGVLVLVVTTLFYDIKGQTTVSEIYQPAPIHDSQIEFMLELKAGLDAGGSILSSWQRNNSCEDWIGVTCDGRSKVVAIILSHLPSIHSDFTLMTPSISSGKTLEGSILSVIGQLRTLTVLNLNGNGLVGSLPSTIGNLTNLESLDLSSNRINGTLPVELMNCTSLVIIDIRLNRFSGTVPFLISKLQKLNYMDFSYNNFSGQIPSSIGELINMKYLYFSVNNFSGAIPSTVSNMSSIEDLYLDYNNLNSTIPDFPHLSLRHLALRQNYLSGDIPIIGSKNIIKLDLSGNYLTGAISNQTLPKLQYLLLYWNAFIEEFPRNLHSNFPSLQYLDLSYNTIYGTLPESIGFCSGLKELKAWSMNLTGSIPSTIANLTNLEVLDLSGNRLSGSLPQGLANLTNLNILNLEDNFNLDGTLDVLSENHQNSQNLTSILLSNNSFTGEIPDFFSKTGVIFRFEISGNPLCNNGSISEYCEAPTPYKPPLVCPSLSCATVEETVNLAVYYSSNNCTCSLPVRITLVFFSLPLTVFNGQTALRVRREVAGATNLTVDQVWISSVTVDIPILVVNISIFSSNKSRLTTLSIIQIEHILSDPRFHFSQFLGPFTRVSAQIPTLPNVDEIDSEIRNITSGSTSSPAEITKQDSITSDIVAIAVASAIAITVAVVLTFYCFRGRMKRQSSFTKRVQEHFVRPFSLQEIIAATHAFSDQQRLVGQDNDEEEVYFCTVSQRQLSQPHLLQPSHPSHHHSHLEQSFVVRRRKEGAKWSVEDFQNTVDIISRTSHSNLVRLLGFCEEGNEQILIFEFVSAQTLKLRLRMPPVENQSQDQSWKPLSFLERLGIALEAAEGLRYLHTYANPTIVHGKFSSEIIILDDRGQVKIADYGMSQKPKKTVQGGVENGHGLKLGGKEDVHESGVNGEGTMAEQNAEEQQENVMVDSMQDVYSFGQVIMEIISGKPWQATNSNSLLTDCEVSQEDLNLTMKSGEVTQLVDPCMGEYPLEGLLDMLRIAKECTQPDLIKRPGMDNVASRLRSIQMSMEQKDVGPDNDVEEDNIERTVAFDGPYGDHSIVLGAPLSGEVQGR